MRRIAIILALSLLGSFAGEAQQRFSRGFEGQNKVFIPAGSFGMGLSAGYRNFGVGKDNGFTLLSDHILGLQGAYTTAWLSPSVEYFVKDNISIIGRFNYGGLKVDLDQASLSLSEDLGLDIRDQHFQRQSYELALGTRVYVPFMGSKIFGWFVEGSLNGGYIQSKMYAIEETLKQGTYNDNWTAAFRIDPGICFFVSENFDFEVSVGLIDLTWQKTAQKENQVYNSTNSGLGGSLSIDILDIRFGAHFYL